MAKKGRRPKHIPQRTCVGCREVTAKGGLLRLVRTPEGILPDPTGKLAGRGAYVHANQDCMQRALKGALVKALHTPLQSVDHERLREFMQTLPPQRAEEETA